MYYFFFFFKGKNTKIFRLEAKGGVFSDTKVNKTGKEKKNMEKYKLKIKRKDLPKLKFYVDRRIKVTRSKNNFYFEVNGEIYNGKIKRI